jgi:GT2 family glycosyltransferase
MQPILSLVVLGFRNFDVTTRACLDSLLPWANDPQIEILILDNGSDDDSAQKTRLWCADHPCIRCLLSETNLGFAGGMNLGASYVTGKWLVLVNNDTVFPAGALDALKCVVNEAPAEVAMLGPVTNAAGNGQQLWKPGATHAEWLQIGRELNENPTSQLMPTYRCDFFCIAIRHDVWNQLEGLDLAFGLGYYEDFDFSLRLAKAGYRQMITEDVFVLHVGSATFKASPAATKALMRRNKKLLKAKHPDARFQHTRLGNLAVLLRYQDLKKHGIWSPAFILRLDLRNGALRSDAPKSWIKKWLWLRYINHKYQHEAIL